MRINHLIVESTNVLKSISFYVDFLGFSEVAGDSGRLGGRILENKNCGIIILPQTELSLRNATHFAFQVDTVDDFERLLTKAHGLNLEPRSQSARDSKTGSGEFTRGGKIHKNFYVLDPSGINVEIMWTTFSPTMKLDDLASSLERVSDICAEKFQIKRDTDWFVLKIQEELGELVSSHLKLTERARRSNEDLVKVQNNLEQEVADVLAMTILFARHKGINIEQAIKSKWLSHL